MKEIITDVLLQADIASGDPSGNPVTAFVLSVRLPQYTARSTKWLVTAEVTVAPATITVWGALAGGAAGTAADDVWGKHNDRHGRTPAGVMVTTMPLGIQHFVLEDLGIYTQVYFQKSTGTVNIYLSPIAVSKVP